MTTTMRAPTLQSLGLGTPLEIFKRGRLPIEAGDLVDQIFGKAPERGSLVISGANGIVGSGKAMQLGSRLEPYGVTIVALDLPGALDGIGRHHAGLAKGFGAERAGRIMQGIARLAYDGKGLPAALHRFKPRFLLEAIPEILDLKRIHYALFRDAFPGIEIRSVTSGFPSGELGVPIAHPAFPHHINKVWEVVEPAPSAVTKLFWALGMTPVAVGDHWSFVLDVLFCGLTLSALKLHGATNMPCWKADKCVRMLVGPNPLRAHDAIGAKGANFLTWSCLHHLSRKYGDLFKPTDDLVERKETGQEWYPPNHFRPLVDWRPSKAEGDEIRARILGPLFEMTALMIHERRGPLAHINAMGELCAQFRRGAIAMMRGMGSGEVLRLIEEDRSLRGAEGSFQHAAAIERMDSPEWQQLYVNAEHDGEVGVITIGRESYSADVDAELNRAISWLKAAGIGRAIVTGDFHLASQMVGADTSDFFPALRDREAGLSISTNWSRTARRLSGEFKSSVGFINGKRCLGGMLELMMHCHHVVSAEGAELGMPEVGLPVVPGMEGCHWPFRRAGQGDWPKIMELLLGGRAVKAADAVGWLIDFAGPMDGAIQVAWRFARGEGEGRRRVLDEGPLKGLPREAPGLAASGDPAIEAGRKAIMDCIHASCGAKLSEALAIQAGHSADFMSSEACRRGRIGQEFQKAMS